MKVQMYGTTLNFCFRAERPERERWEVDGDQGPAPAGPEQISRRVMMRVNHKGGPSGSAGRRDVPAPGVYPGADMPRVPCVFSPNLCQQVVCQMSQPPPEPKTVPRGLLPPFADAGSTAFIGAPTSPGRAPPVQKPYEPCPPRSGRERQKKP